MLVLLGRHQHNLKDLYKLCKYDTTNIYYRVILEFEYSIMISFMYLPKHFIGSNLYELSGVSE
jgi:hypothetical protein